MAERLHHSLLWWLLHKLKHVCTHSLLALLLHKLWHSRPLDACRRFLAKPPAAERSALDGCMTGFNRLLWRFGQWLAPHKDASLCVRGLRGLGRAVKRSVLLGWLFRDGLRTFLVTVLGLFGVIDWLLRDVYQIPVFSSLWDEALLVVAILLVLHRRVVAPRPLRAGGNVQDLPILQFLGVCAVLFVLTTEYTEIAITGLRATAQSILWFFVVTRLLERKEDLRRMYLMMVLAAFVISLHGIYQYIVAVPIPSTWVDQAEASVRTRVFSIFGSPNIMGDYMVLFAPMTFALAYYAKKRWQKLLAVGMTLCMLLACLFTMSRGAWIGVAVAVVVFALTTDLRILLLALLGGMLSLLLPFVRSRILYLFSNAFVETASRGGREMRWAKAFGYLSMRNPMIGLGFGRFGGAVAMQNQITPSFEYFYVDNYYMKILSENGYIGLGSYLLMMLGLLWSGFRSWYAVRRRAARPLVSGMFAGLCGVLVHCYFENIFEEPYMLAYFWCIAAMMVFLGMRQGRTPAGENDAR